LAGVTETRLTGNGLSRIGDHTVIHSGADQEHSNGVALILDKRLSNSLESWEAVSARILTARLLHKHGHNTVITVYAPLEGQPYLSVCDPHLSALEVSFSQRGVIQIDHLY